jgi:glycerol-3-phosphate acyltransferase PlsY
VAVTACLGHMFPVFFEFSGGKAVATAFGAILPLGLDLAALLLTTWVLVLLLTRYSSLAAIVCVGLSPFFTWIINPVYSLPVAVLAVLIILRHKENIIRLLTHKEPKIWDKSRINK